MTSEVLAPVIEQPNGQITTEQLFPETVALELFPKQGILAANLRTLTGAEAEALAKDYLEENFYHEPKEIFETRFVALRDKVPAEVAQKWDGMAEGYAKISNAFGKGDNRPLKDWAIRSGMELNIQGQADSLNGRPQRMLGNALYVVGSLIPTRTGK